MAELWKGYLEEETLDLEGRVCKGFDIFSSDFLETARETHV